jgi:hypothetical protein
MIGCAANNRDQRVLEYQISEVGGSGANIRCRSDIREGSRTVMNTLRILEKLKNKNE